MAEKSIFSPPMRPHSLDVCASPIDTTSPRADTPSSTADHESTLRAAASHLLHSVRGAGRTVAELAAVLAQPFARDAHTSDEEESSPDFREAFSTDDTDSEDEARYQRARRGSGSAAGLAAHSDYNSDAESVPADKPAEFDQQQVVRNSPAFSFARRLQLRKRMPSYAHLFPPADAEMPPQPIESHGLIGNCHTTALVSLEGSVVWYCYPNHNSPSIFHSLIDQRSGRAGGGPGPCFRITPGREEGATSPTTKQLYYTETNVLLTRFFTDSGVGHVTDYMCMGDASLEHGAKHWLVRELEVVRGKMYFEVECAPAFDYGRATHTTEILPHGALFTSAGAGLAMLVTSSKARVWKSTPNGGARTKVKLQEGQRVVFVFREWCEEKERAKWSETCVQEELVERQRVYLQEQLERLDLPTAISTAPTSAAGTPAPGTPTSARRTMSPVKIPFARTLSDDHANTPSPFASRSSAPPINPPMGVPLALLRVPSIDAAITTGPPSAARSVAASEASSGMQTPHRDFDATFGTHSIRPISISVTDRLRRETTEFWREWVSKCPYEGRWREGVRRSALMLKLLTFQPTGAIIQAPTCGLPSKLGVAGLDFRHVNLRDASVACASFLRLGFRNEASSFMSWLANRCAHSQRPDGSLQLMYSIHGDEQLDPVKLPHLSGYRGSGPIEIGNPNAKRYCLDVYGALLNAVHLSNEVGEPISYELWRYTRSLVSFVCAHWQDTDEGVWSQEQGVEGTGGCARQHFIVSKIMSWVALDRGIKLAHERSFPAPFDEWKRARDQVYAEVQQRGYNTTLRSFVQAYDSTHLDAALLLMPVTGFIAPTDPKCLNTLDAITRSVNVDGLTSASLIHKSNATEAKGYVPQITTSICSFWAVEACTRAGLADPRYLTRARLLMEQMLGYANHLGLFSECIGLRGDFLGNYPHLLTHVSLIRAVVYLDLALDKQKPHTIVQAMIDDVGLTQHVK